MKKNAHYFIQKGTQPSQACSVWHITPNPTPKIDAGDASLLMGSIKTRTRTYKKKHTAQKPMLRVDVCARCVPRESKRKRSWF
jgi:hypothetical protein